MPRGLFEERLAGRTERERTLRGWSYQDLSRAMAAAGVPIDRSSIQRIEKGSRRVNVDELVSLSRVFGIPMETMVESEELVLAQEVRSTFENWVEASRVAHRAVATQRGLATIMRRRFAKSPEAVDLLDDLVREYSAKAFAAGSDDPAAADDEVEFGDALMRSLTAGVEELRAAWQEGEDG